MMGFNSKTGLSEKMNPILSLIRGRMASNSGTAEVPVLESLKKAKSSSEASNSLNLN